MNKGLSGVTIGAGKFGTILKNLIRNPRPACNGPIPGIVRHSLILQDVIIYGQVRCC
jgi:hypothetical protein